MQDFHLTDKGIIDKFPMESISGGSFELLKKYSKIYEDACKYIDNVYEKNYPCLEVIYVQIKLTEFQEDFACFEEYWNGSAVRMEFL